MCVCVCVFHSMIPFAKHESAKRAPRSAPTPRLAPPPLPSVKISRFSSILQPVADHSTRREKEGRGEKTGGKKKRKKRKKNRHRARNGGDARHWANIIAIYKHSSRWRAAFSSPIFPRQLCICSPPCREIQGIARTNSSTSIIEREGRERGRRAERRGHRSASTTHVRVSACNLMISSRNFDDGNWNGGENGEKERTARGDEERETDRDRERGRKGEGTACVQRWVGQGRLVAHAQNLT